MERVRVLVVEDDPALAELLHYNLEKEDYEPRLAADGEQALALIDRHTPDLLILDWMLPKVSGLEVCRRVRAIDRTESLPIIMLTARADDSDTARGLDAGADDYITKPVSMVELFARIRAILRRTRPEVSQDIAQHGDISLDRAAFQVRRAGREVHLGPTEFRLLEYLIRSPRRVFSREQLLDAVWGADIFVEARTVDVHVGRLRKALMEGGRPNPIRTVRSAGYSLDVE